jgi:general secretion pathway protein G
MKIVKIILACLIIIAILYMLISRRPKPGTEKPPWEAVIPKMEPVRAAINTYILNTGRLPRGLLDLIACPEGLEDTWAGPYLKESQLYDPWGNMYILEYGYRLQSLGADGIKGGDGQNSDAEKFTELTK